MSQNGQKNDENYAGRGEKVWVDILKVIQIILFLRNTHFTMPTHIKLNKRGAHISTYLNYSAILTLSSNIVRAYVRTYRARSNVYSYVLTQYQCKVCHALN